MGLPRSSAAGLFRAPPLNVRFPLIPAVVSMRAQ
jgi:hypothetical protein